MPRLKFCLSAAVVLACGLGVAAAERRRAIRSGAAVSAMRKYEAVVQKADRERDERVAAARGVAVDELNRAVTAATKDGDLDEAVAIRAAVDDLKAEQRAAGSVRTPEGEWDVVFTNGVRHIYEIRKDGVLNIRHDGKVVGAGPLARRQSQWLFENPTGKSIERLTLAGDLLFSEYFEPASRFPSQHAQYMAVGTRRRPGAARERR